MGIKPNPLKAGVFAGFCSNQSRSHNQLVHLSISSKIDDAEDDVLMMYKMMMLQIYWIIKVL